MIQGLPEFRGLISRLLPKSADKVSSVSQPVRATPADSVASLPSGYRLTGGGLQFEIPLEKVVTLGRKTGSDVHLEDSLVSREHALMRVKGGLVQICDLGSRGGTRLNGAELEPKLWVPLPPGAVLNFAGSVEMKLEGLDATSPSSRPLPQQGMATAVGAAASAVGGPVGAVLGRLQLSDLNALANREQLEKKESYLSSIQAAQAQLSKETGIVDLPHGVPTLVLSDLHARRDFVMKALEYEVDGVKVFELLQQGKINLVCVGDGMHAEGRAAERWRRAEQDMMEGKPSMAMHQEMIESFGTMKMVMDLKSEFPENFHFVRGNHDEIKGNFAKYARNVGESAMVQRWVQQNLGQDFLDQYAQFENTMPLVVRGQGFVASHAAPGGTLNREAVQQRDAKAFAQLAWTENRNWNDQDSQVQARFQNNLKEVGGEGSHWLVGHRPVDQGHFRSQFDGQLIQINAPNDFVAALVPADGQFDPQRDVFRLT